MKVSRAGRTPSPAGVTARRARRALRAAAVASVVALAVAACGGSSTPSSSTAKAPDNKPITLKINFWGDFGFKQLQPEYKKLHPNVTLVLNAGDYNQQHQDLQKFLVAGSGAPDIAAIDEGFIVQFRNQADKFVNLLDEKGGAAYAPKYLPWKWKESLSADGKTQIGLGTDVGGQAMCYRTDLFKAAGLPTDRAAVSALWPTWDDFVTVGQKYVKNSGGKKFVDAATNIMNPVLAQQPVGYFDTDENLKMDGGPKVAWDTANKVIAAGLSANLASFTPEWNAAFKNGKFAVLACPAWMMGYIQGQAPDTKGKWDVAAIPGGGGNWGGSFLTIPKQGKNNAAAWDFIQWAVQPAQQIAIFKNIGNLPSQPALYTDPAILDFKNPFFSDAPVGKIFSDTAKNLTPQYLGKKSGPVRVSVENVLRKVEQGKTSGAAAWSEAVKEAQKAATA
jgi:cellobiose transport system substrate-binding protein